ncbi:MAG: AAA family ATPase [Candidatus Omnitrophica bacterium CG11_big_fil_rev_8_21_14_0_20_42_13]|uniref:Replication-associated recombination protein A n=1 Tax=Candidatus Ghiorseimicrobium undicola TaxID=1974746 RepID=A0A2H0LZR7_9BACT|nr:MAG: AAA family ATPase [Candidatus Omnitrophica bacterium CG11_big_fil_rev_8_21_14_0_20_42_13]
MKNADYADLFKGKITANNNKDLPLAARMRPQNLSEFAGQEHILAKGKLLRRAIEADSLSSVIFYGPPGVGKTSLAACIGKVTKSYFENVNAVSCGVDELRKIIRDAKMRKIRFGQKTILFIDEVHRFNKAQQDVLMPDVEEASVILIGATVENPFFYLIPPLVSRSLVFELKALSEDNIKFILRRALNDKKNGFGNIKITITEEALNFLAKICEGDARRALGALEIAVRSSAAENEKKALIKIGLDIAEESVQRKAVVYGGKGDAHYDAASAFIKSMRGSDPDSALYWMAKMLYAGEDPRFIARRICILAAEDVGNADPLALVLAQAALQVAEFVGMPEARIPLAQACIYVSCAPKSNASYLAIDKAYKDIEKERTQEVPDHLKDASYSGAKSLGRGKGYKYAHDYPGHYVSQKYTTKKARYYEPQDLGYEAKIKKRMEKLRAEEK